MQTRFRKTAIMSRDGRYASAPGRRALVNTAVLLALAAGPAAQAAVGDAVGSVFTVNTTSRTLSYPQVAMGAEGSFVVTWGAGSSGPTMARCLDADGTALSGEVTVSAAGSGYQSAVAADAAGNSVVVWLDDADELYAQRLDSSCAPQGAVIDIGAGVNLSIAKRYYDVAMAVDGRFVVVRYDGSATYAQRYDADGNPQGTAITVASGNSYNLPIVTSRADGGFVVSWCGDDVRLRYYDADGNPETDLITYTLSGTNTIKGVAMDGDGDVAVFWESFYDYQIHAQRFNASGDRVGGNLDVPDDAAVAYSAGYYKEDPGVAMDDDGDFQVAWENLYNAAGIGAQRFDSADNKHGEVVVDASTGSYPKVAMDADGDSVIVWDVGSDIHAQRYEGKGQTVDVSVTGSADVTTIDVGNDVTYTWTVTNNGSGTVLAISLDDVLPSGLAYSRYTDSLGDGWACSDTSGTVTCTLPRLVAGGSSSVELVLDTSGLSGSSVDNSATGSTVMSDTDSSNDSDTVSLTINNAPTFDTAPVVSGTAAVGTTLSVSTPTVSDAEGDSYTVSYQWQADGVDISGATSDSYTLTSAEAHAAITAVLTATDTGGAFSSISASSVTVANTAPSFDATPSLSGTAEIGNTLSVTGTATSDADGDSVSLTYQWQADGVAISAATSDSVTLTNAEAHAVITVVVTADDGYDTTSITSSSATVANRLPTFDATPSISGTAMVGNTLSVINTATSDEDGDAVSLSYQWQADGVDISGATADRYTLTSSEAHSTITVVVTADDGYDTTDVTTAGVTVENTAPVISGVDISGSANPGETVTAVVSGKDSDGDSLSYSYEWYVDGVLAGSAESYTIGSGDIDKNLFVLVTVSDGNGGTDSNSSLAYAITGSNPVFATTPGISGSALTGGTLSADRVSASDADGDSITYSYQWRSNGAAISGATASSYILTGAEAHSIITLEVTADDSSGGSATVISSSVMVQNSSPVFGATPRLSGTPSMGETISISGLTVNDADGDSISYSYQWYVGGSLVGSDSSYTLQSEDVGKSVMVIVFADDGYGGLVSATASGMTVTNHAPTFAATPAISGIGEVGEELVLVGTSATDADGDSITLAYQWQADGVDISGATADSYTVQETEAGSEITAVITASDVYGASSSATTEALTIAESNTSASSSGSGGGGAFGWFGLLLGLFGLVSRRSKSVMGR